MIVSYRASSLTYVIEEVNGSTYEIMGSSRTDPGYLATIYAKIGDNGLWETGYVPDHWILL